MLTYLEVIKSKFKSMRSLRVRIFFLVLIVGIVPCCIIQYGILRNYRSKAIAVRMASIQTQLRIIADHLNNYNYIQDTSSPAINAELEQLSNLYDGRVLVINRDLKIVKDTYGISEGKTIISEEVIRCFQGESISNYDSVFGYIEQTVPLGFPSAEEDGDTVNGVMLIGVSTDVVVNTMEALKAKSNIILLIIAIVVMGLALILSKVMVKPFEKVTGAISEVKEGYSDTAIDVPDCLETEHIVEAFNQLLGRMKVLDDSRQEFVANVSHELKTPITSMKVLADSLLAQEEVPAELYREFMEDIAEEIDRENTIITDLLSLVKMDKTVAELNVSEVNMNELTEVVLKRLRPIARKRDIEVTFESLRQVKAVVDEVKITLIISNLVENAIKYNKEHGWVKVVLDADHQFFTLEVSDSGIGIPEESVEYIYERFYRVDKSHSREIGGTGLGLAITRSAILMHRGSIQVESVPEEGTKFTVKIPLTYITS